VTLRAAYIQLSVLQLDAGPAESNWQRMATQVEHVSATERSTEEEFTASPDFCTSKNSSRGKEFARSRRLFNSIYESQDVAMDAGSVPGNLFFQHMLPKIRNLPRHQTWSLKRLDMRNP